MNLDNKKIAGYLNELLTRNFEAAKGYREAANSVDYAELRKWFFDNSERREKMKDQLETQVEAMGGTPDEGTSLLGELHIAYLDLKSDIFQNDPHAVLEECMRGEEKALEDYKEVYKQEGFPTEINRLLETHMNEIKESISGIKVLKPAFDDA